MVSADFERIDRRGLHACHAIDRRPIAHRGFQNRLIQSRIKTCQQCLAPVRAHHGQSAEQCICTPVRHASQDQMRRRRDTGNVCSMHDMRRNHLARQISHADLVAAITNRDGVPWSGKEYIVEQRRRVADVLTTHIAWGPIRSTAATLDGNHVPNVLSTPQCYDVGNRADIDRHAGDARRSQRDAARGCARSVGANAAGQSDTMKSAREKRGPDRTVGFRRWRPTGRHEETGDDTDRAARIGQCCDRSSQTAPRGREHRRDVAPHILLDGRLDRVD